MDAPEIQPYPAASFLYITSLSPSSAINRWMLFWNNQQHALVLSLCFKKMKLQISRFHSFPCQLKSISRTRLCGSRLAPCSLPPTAVLRDRHSEQNWGQGVSEVERFPLISRTITHGETEAQGGTEGSPRPQGLPWKLGCHPLTRVNPCLRDTGLDVSLYCGTCQGLEQLIRPSQSR